MSANADPKLLSITDITFLTGLQEFGIQVIDIIEDKGVKPFIHIRPIVMSRGGKRWGFTWVVLELKQLRYTALMVGSPKHWLFILAMGVIKKPLY